MPIVKHSATRKNHCVLCFHLSTTRGVDMRLLERILRVSAAAETGQSPNRDEFGEGTRRTGRNTYFLLTNYLYLFPCLMYSQPEAQIINT